MTERPGQQPGTEQDPAGAHEAPAGLPAEPVFDPSPVDLVSPAGEPVTVPASLEPRFRDADYTDPK